MSRLIRDRYYVCGAHEAWDLATGDTVRLDALEQAAPAHERSIDTLVEVLDHGRDGAPRWIVADVLSGVKPRALLRRAADDGQKRGFVPIALEVYLRLRDVLAEELGERTLLLIGFPGASMTAARAAFVDAAARSPRPHVLLTCRSNRQGTATCVREARAAYGVAAAIPSRPAGPLPPDVVRYLTRAQRADEFVRAGRHAAAVRLLRDVAGALTRRRASGAAAQTLLVLTRLLLDRGRAADADAAAEEAVVAARNAGDEALGLQGRLWQATARTERGQLTSAESICRAVLLGGGLSTGHQAWASAALARVLLWQNRTEEAAALDLTLPGDAGPELTTSAFVRGTAVRVLLATNRMFEAGGRAREALVHAGGEAQVGTIAATAQLRVLAATGDLVLAAECLSGLVRRAREARLPLAIVRARLIWLDALDRAGRSRDADRERAYLRRIRRVAPPLLRHGIDVRLGGRPRSPAAPASPAREASAAAATLVSVAQDEEHDRDAVRRILEHTRDVIGAGRIDLWSSDAGPASILMTAGSGIATGLGVRALEAGIAIRGDRSESGEEIAAPVRMGARLLAAVVARWPLDRSSSPRTEELLALAAAVAAPRIEAMLSAARVVAQAATAVPELVGVSKGMADVRKAIARAAGAPFSVLIQGESGVGKELVARAIHQLSPRRERRFCDVNCAALPDDLLESELFGHARGAFTGAVVDRAGLFEDADGGTLFLDEVVDLSARAQAKLLRVLQQHEVRRVGETFSRTIDVRIVSAANRDLRDESAGGRFRQDLLYRLDVIRIAIPPLRERPEDVPPLAAHFWRAAAARVGTTATLSHGVLTALSRYHWPGNVRELQNVMAALAVAAPSRGRVGASLLPGALAGAVPPPPVRLADARAQFERRFIEVALARAGGSRSRAARELGLSRQGLLKTMKRLELDTASGSAEEC